jgi:two-component system phosphate regulon response regulator OmpR
MRHKTTRSRLEAATSQKRNLFVMQQHASLLVVDDEPEICAILTEYFSAQGFAVTAVHSAVAARDEFERQSFQLVILDLRMPGEDGLSLARWIREHRKGVGVVMLTTAAEVVDRVVGLELGADDYVPKPFELRELLARVRSVLRRLAPGVAPVQETPRPRFGQCQLDLEARKLVNAHGQEIALTAMEFDLLKLFAANPNRVLNRDQIMQLAHHRGWEVFDRSIDLRIMRLRRKVEIDPEKPEVIKTIRAVGYMYAAA